MRIESLMISISKEQYLGLEDKHLVYFKNEADNCVFMADKDAIAALQKLCEDALKKGIELTVASAHRSFYRQFKIFDDKFKGKRAVLDENELPQDISNLTDEEKVRAIMRFSAVPGLSRHHFGTDFDIYAKNLLPAGKTLELTSREYNKDNYFYPLGQYLANNLQRFGFSRPYTGKGRIAYEPWHISYTKKATEYLMAYDIMEVIAYLSSFHEPWVKYAINYAKDCYHEILGENYDTRS